MEGRFDSGALDTLIAITGTNEAVGTRLLQVNGGDLNAAVNSFYNDADILGSGPERDDRDRNDFMEEDEPATGMPVQPNPPFVPRLVWESTNWNSRDRLEERSAAHASDNFANVAEPPWVRKVSIDYRDGDDDDEDITYGTAIRPIDLSNPRVEEIPSHSNNVPSAPTLPRAMVDDDIPSTASSVYRSGVPSVDRLRFGGSGYFDDDIEPSFNPNAPVVSEIPPMTTDEGNDIEEEMLRAAIEASRWEAAEANRREPPTFPEETMDANNVGDRPITPRGIREDDDLARAVTLSLKTAEEEKALRERGMPSSEAEFMQDDEDSPSSEDIKNLDVMRRRGIARDRAGMARSSNSTVGIISSGRDRDRRSSGSRSSTSNNVPNVSTPPEEAEEVEEQPLLRRRTSRRSIPSTVESGIEGSQAQSRGHVDIAPVQEGEPPVLPSPVAVGVLEEGAGVNHAQENHESFPGDEWGGISSEEQDEAVMLEALFGGGNIPERGMMGMPYPVRRGGLRGSMMNNFGGEEAGNPFDSFGRRAFPQPPSPTVVAQRLIREQQDGEYQASLAADREKELKAIAEAEELRRKAVEAAEAARSEERLRQEEEFRKRREAEDLGRQLALKKESLPLEPAADEQGALNLVVRMPDGSRRGRRFHKSNKLHALFDFIDIGGDVKPGTYRLVRQFPRVAFMEGQRDSTLESVGLTSRQEVLLVEIM